MVDDAQRSRSLLEIALAVTSATDLDDVLEGVALTLLDATSHSRASIFLLDTEKAECRLVRSVGVSPVEIGAVVATRDASTPLRKALEERHTVLADYDSIGEEATCLPSEAESHLALIVPIVFGERVLGAVLLDDPGVRKDFSRSDIGLAEEIAVLAGSAVETARLVSALQETNENLAAVNQRLEAHMENSPLGVVEFDPAFRIIRWSEEAERIFGWSAAEIIGKCTTDIKLVVEDDMDLVQGEFRGFLTGEKRRDLNTNRNYRKDGSVILCEWYSSAIYDANGELVSILSEVLDITDRATAEEAAAQREKRLRLATETEGLGVLSWDMISGGVVWENDRMYEIFGRARARGPLSADEFLDAALHPHDRKAFDRALTDATLAGKLKVTGRVRREDDGAWRWLEFTAAVDRTENGTPKKLFGVVRDVTDRQHAEARTLQHSMVLEGINEVLDAALRMESEEALGKICLGVAERITASAFGVIGEMTQDGVFRDIAMSDEARASCRMAGEGGRPRMPLESGFKGLVGKVIKDASSLLTNNPSRHPESAGTPEGHLPIKAFVGVPLTREGRAVGVLAVANRAGGYTREDQMALEALAPAVIQAFARLRSERALRESREDLTRAQAVSQVGSWRLDTVNDVLEWSDETYRMFGIPEGTALTYELFLERIHPEDREMVDERWQAALEGEPYDVEHRIVVDDTVRWVREQAGLEFDEEGNLRGGFGTVHDITAEKAADAVRDSLYQQVETERTRLRRVIDEVPIGFALMSPTGEVLEINAATHDLWGLRLPKAHSFEEFEAYRGYHRDTGRPLLAEEWPGVQAAKTKEPAEAVIDIERRDGSRRAARIRAMPMKNKNGELSLVAVITEDVQDAVEREELAVALGEIVTAAGACREAEEALTHILDISARALRADRAAVLVKTGGEWQTDIMYEGESVSCDPGTSCDSPLSADALESMSLPVAIADARFDPRCDPEKVSHLGLRSLLEIPIRSEGRLFGSLLYCFGTEQREFSAAQLDFAARLMDHATIALDSVWAYQRERTIAQTLQEAIISPPEKIEGVAVAYLYQPAAGIADVGGDFFDVFEAAAGKVVIAVGDVSGKGIHAARITSLLRDGIRAYSYGELHPEVVLERLNSLVYRMSPVTVFATVFLGVLDVAKGTLRFCSAGHPPACMMREDGAEHIGECRDSVVGAFEHARYHAHRAKVDRDCTLVVYTDGLIEARTGDELFGERGVLEALSRAREVPFRKVPQYLYDAALEFCGGAIRDDTVVLCVCRTPCDDEAE